MYVQRLEGLLASVLSAETATTGKQPRSPYRGSIGKGRRRSRSVSPLLPSSSPSSSSSSDHDKLQGYRQYIAEEILTLKCPREGCRRAFLDFDGCFALTCPGCGCGFCAACIEDCGDDAHEHCKKVHQGLFGSIEKFNEIQRYRRLGAVTKYLTEVVCVQESKGWVEQLLLAGGGPLEKDLGEVRIGVEEVKRVLAGRKLVPLDLKSDGSVGAVVAVAGGGGGGGKVLAVRLEANDGQQQQQQRRRRGLLWMLLDGPGYGAEEEKDAVSLFWGPLVTASFVVAGMWRLDDALISSSSGSSSSAGEMWGVGTTQLFWGLVAGPAMVLLLTGRGKVVVQSLYRALLTGLVVVPIYLFSEPLITFVVMILVHVLSVAAHILGMLLDLTVEGARLSGIMLTKVSVELAALYTLVGVKEALSAVGLLPPVDMGLEMAMF